MPSVAFWSPRFTKKVLNSGRTNLEGGRRSKGFFPDGFFSTSSSSSPPAVAAGFSAFLGAATGFGASSFFFSIRVGLITF